MGAAGRTRHRASTRVPRSKAISQLASVLRARGKSSEAKSLLSQAVEEAEDLLGDEHEITQSLGR